MNSGNGQMDDMDNSHGQMDDVDNSHGQQQWTTAMDFMDISFQERKKCLSMKSMAVVHIVHLSIVIKRS
jgi:hypothetical protein